MFKCVCVSKHITSLFIDLKEGDLLPWLVYFGLLGSALCTSTTAMNNWLETTKEDMSDKGEHAA